jgi:hypothetical protein
MVKAVRTDLNTEGLTPGWENKPKTTGLNDCQIVPQIINFAQSGGYSNLVPMNRLYNAAYEKFTSAVKGDVAEILVNLAERQEMLNLMSRRVIGFCNAARAFRRLQFADAARYLGVRPPTSQQQKRWRHPRQWGANWLEWHFGWSPTISDIYALIEIFEGSLPLPVVTEASGWKLGVDTVVVEGAETKVDKFDGIAYCRLSSGIQVSDLFVLKASQMGLINPASVAWELIPFSFLADWFGTIGLWLGQFSDFMGIDLHWPQHVYYIFGKGNRRYVSPPTVYGSWNFNYSVAAVRRLTGSFPGPTIALRRPKGLSVTRGLTAISLILGLFANY